MHTFGLESLSTAPRHTQTHAWPFDMNQNAKHSQSYISDHASDVCRRVRNGGPFFCSMLFCFLFFCLWAVFWLSCFFFFFLSFFLVAFGGFVASAFLPQHHHQHHAPHHLQTPPPIMHLLNKCGSLFVFLEGLPPPPQPPRFFTGPLFGFVMTLNKSPPNPERTLKNPEPNLNPFWSTSN